MTITRFLARSAVACTALMIAAAPALAASHDAGSHDTTNAQKLEVHNDGKGHVLYCAVMPAVTGSIIDTKVCKTFAQWKAQGVNFPPEVEAANVKARA